VWPATCWSSRTSCNGSGPARRRQRRRAIFRDAARRRVRPHRGASAVTWRTRRAIERAVEVRREAQFDASIASRRRSQRPPTCPKPPRVSARRGATARSSSSRPPRPRPSQRPRHPPRPTIAATLGRPSSLRWHPRVRPCSGSCRRRSPTPPRPLLPPSAHPLTSRHSGPRASSLI
jgi:hypothetical protein